MILATILNIFGFTNNKPAKPSVPASAASAAGGDAKVETPSQQSAAEVKAVDPKSKKEKVAAKAPVPSAKSGNKLLGFFRVEPVRIDIIADEDAAYRQHNSLIRLIKNELIVIVVLTLVLMGALPFAHPIYQYFALSPEKKVMPLAGLNMPNMTDKALLSWVTVVVTEVMTMGFGDYEPHIKAQKYRFTDDGWESFAVAFDRQKIGESFKLHQLVLTTVPSNTPVVVGQGVNGDNVYQWNVQLPVVMNFATNNNTSRKQSSVVRLAIVRVSTEQDPSGIAIKSWVAGGD